MSKNNLLSREQLAFVLCNLYMNDEDFKPSYIPKLIEMLINFNFLKTEWIGADIFFEKGIRYTQISLCYSLVKEMAKYDK